MEEQLTHFTMGSNITSKKYFFAGIAFFKGITGSVIGSYIFSVVHVTTHGRMFINVVVVTVPTKTNGISDFDIHFIWTFVGDHPIFDRNGLGGVDNVNESRKASRQGHCSKTNRVVLGNHVVETV